MSSDHEDNKLGEIFNEYMQKKQELIQGLYAETRLANKRVVEGTDEHRRTGEGYDSGWGARDRGYTAKEADMPRHYQEVLRVYQRLLQSPLSSSELVDEPK